MRLKIAAAAAGIAGCLHYAPAQAAVPGYYQATFVYPGGTFTACFTLAQTDTFPGYTSSGTWVDTSVANASGSYVVYKKTIHLAGPYGAGNFISIDGQFSGTHLVNTTFDLFNPQGQFFSAGYFTEMRDPACAQAAP